MRKPTAVILVMLVLGCNRERGSGGKTLLLDYPAELSLVVGKPSTVEVKVDRKRFDGEIRVMFPTVPDGVQILDMGRSIPPGSKTTSVTLMATEESVPGKGQVARVEARGGGVTAGPFEIKVNVKENKARAPDSKELEQWAQTQLNDISKSMEALRKRTKAASIESRRAIDKELARLQKDREALQERLSRAKTTTAEAWQEFSRGLREAAWELRESARKAVDKLKD